MKRVRKYSPVGSPSAGVSASNESNGHNNSIDSRKLHVVKKTRQLTRDNGSSVQATNLVGLGPFRLPDFNCPIPLKSVCSAYLSFIERTADPIILSSLLSRRQPNVQPGVLLLVVPNLDRLFKNSIETMSRKPFAVQQLTPNIDLLGSPEYALYVTTIIKRYFNYGCVTQCSGSNKKLYSPLVDLLQLMKDENQLREEKMKAASKEKCNDPVKYLVTEKQFISRGWKLPLEISKKSSLPQGWIQTCPYTPNGPTSPIRIAAIDCEMCITTKGRELTRVTVMDFDCNIILDELVIPENPIVDYLTQYSGMSEEKLKEAKYTQAQIQAKLVEIFNFNTIMIGHGLTNDLEAIKIVHPFIIDTALVYTHFKGPPYLPGLKYLAETYLKRDIQGGTDCGHDSIEDCKAVIDLVKLKLNEDTRFGVNFVNTETIFTRLARVSNDQIRSAVVDYNSLLPFTEGASMYYPCTNDKQVREHIIEEMKKGVNIVMGRLQALDVDFENLGSENSRINTAFGTNEIFDTSQKVLGKFLRSFESLLSKVPKDTIIIVTSGHSYNSELKALYAKQADQANLSKYGQAVDASLVWTQFDDRKLAQEINKAKLGLTFFGLASDV